MYRRPLCADYDAFGTDEALKTFVRPSGTDKERQRLHGGPRGEFTVGPPYEE